MLSLIFSRDSFLSVRNEAIMLMSIWLLMENLLTI
jgi:hypothetical protein